MEVTLCLGTKERKITIHQSTTSEKLLERARTEFNRADIVVEQYSKEDDSCHKLAPNLELSPGDTFEVKIVAEKV